MLRKTITALFCDLAGSTALAESLADPEAIHDVLTRYLRAMTTVIERHGGTVEKFAGDAILGTFGVPLSHEDDALRAVRAAIQMRDALVALNADLRARWDVALELKIGINSGEAVTGERIAGQAMALGDPVNVAARLEQTAEPGDIVLGETTVRLIGDAVTVDEPQALRVKGKVDAVAAYRLVGLRPDGGARSFTRPIQDRADEVGAIRDAFDRVMRAGRAGVLIVEGSPGIGKSRVVAAAVEGMDEALVHSAGFPAYGERTAFWPLAEIVRAHAGVTASDDAATIEAKLVRAVGSVVEGRGAHAWVAERLAALACPPAPDKRPAAVESLDAWALFLERLAAARPVVLVLEDLHRADDPFFGFLARVARSDAPILVLCTARPELDEDRAALAGATFLRLGPLSPRHIGLVVDAVVDDQIPADLREKVIARADGNPLFAEALATMIAERGADLDVEIPDTIDALVAARLDALPSPLRSLVHDAAVIGASIRPEALASMTGTELAEVQDSVATLVRRDLLRPVPASVGYAFWNDLVREVAYRQVPRSTRSAKHDAYAGWLVENVPDSSDVVAHHYGRAFELALEAREDPGTRSRLADLCFRHGVLGARRALGASDPGTATTLLTRAAAALATATSAELDLVGEAGRLLVALGSWSEAVNLLEPRAGTEHPTIVRELGIATCKLHRDDPRGDAYRRGQALLERAAMRDDVDAIASLAGTWKGLDDERVVLLYRRAHELDPTDPYALGNFLEYAVRTARNLSPVQELRDRISDAIDRCHAEVDGGRNLPWAHYDAGKFALLSERPYEGLDACAKAVDVSPAAFMVETSLASLVRLAASGAPIAGLEWSSELLSLALRARFGPKRPRDGSFSEPVVVLAGTTAADDEGRLDDYSAMLVDAFHDAAWTIVSGGTAHGVSRLAAEIRDARAVRTIGYLPRTLPAGIEPDRRYDELRRTSGDSFSPLEPLAYWNDLVRAGVPPARVKVVGIGGGEVAAAEYAIALALGATLGIVRGSGRAAEAILDDPHWSTSHRLTSLEPSALSAFLASQ